ncbi:MAG: hypothetical protein K6G80_03945 [Treponema sp.]|nr:hypothetical protein [Treponema sp.]
MQEDRFPDGTVIPGWFFDTSVPELSALGRQYLVTDYGILDDGNLHTKELQALIDRISLEGGGVLVLPAGTYKTGAIYLRQGVHLHIQRGGMLKGSDNPEDYPVCVTRIEGETCRYFPALVNASGIDGLVISGEGTIDGSGMRAWKAFWQRRDWNPDCTNKDEQRARLLFCENCTNVTIAGLNLQNAQFWTTHLYKCTRVRVLNCRITSPAEPVKAPSTDAIDIDACSDVLVKKCYMSVNDDAVVLKGGKGPRADSAEENGANERILVEDCVYGFCHGCLTVGSESIKNRNILMRRIQVHSGFNLLWLKMRTDTPQHYAYITVEDVQGAVNNFLTLRPWTQFADLQGMSSIPLSRADHITMRRCKITCDTQYNVERCPQQYTMSDFLFEDLQVTAKETGTRPD